MKTSFWFVIVLMALSFLSCEKEEATVIQNTDNGFTKSSAISALIKRVAQSETAWDNVLDGTNCISIKLPVHIYLNSQSMTINSASQYATVQSIKDAYTTDNDIVYFTFPITVVYPNFHEVAVNSQNELNALIAQCGDDSGLHEIECIDFNYPVAINIYNTSNQVGSTITIQNNNQLYNFVEDLANDVIVGIVYPITLTKTNSQQITVNSNSQLENAIDSVIDDCNTSPGPILLEQILSSGSWHISYCYYDYDETYYYSYYDFTFNSNGTVIAVKNSTTINGDWDVNINDNEQRLDLNFDGSQIYKLETSWKAIEITPTYLRFKHENGGSSGNYYLNLTKN